MWRANIISFTEETTPRTPTLGPLAHPARLRLPRLPDAAGHLPALPGAPERSRPAHARPRPVGLRGRPTRPVRVPPPGRPALDHPGRLGLARVRLRRVGRPAV